MEKPIPFLLFENNEVHLTKQATEMLQKIDGPIGVISVIWKKFFDESLDKQAVGPTVNPCTKGIYVWGTPLVVNNISYLLIDTEGIGSVQETQTHDAKIFSLAILLSSYFIYNSVGVIDEHAIDRLSFITNLSKHIQVSSNSGEKHSFAEVFPKMLWVLRDFSLQLVDDQNKPISSTQYLESALRKVSASATKNEVRSTILQNFPDRDCFVLVRPISDEKKLQTIDQVDYKELRDEFKQQMTILQKKIFSEIVPKKLFGQVLNGKSFLKLVEQYVKSINLGKVPTIFSSWEHVVTFQNQSLLEATVEKFKNSLLQLTSKFPTEASELSAIITKIANDLLAEFQENAFGNKEKTTFTNKLKSIMESAAGEITAKNEEVSSKAITAYITNELGELDTNFAKLTTISELKAEVEARRKRIIANCKGPAKAQLILEFEKTIQEKCYFWFENQRRLQEERFIKRIDQISKEKDAAIQSHLEENKKTMKISQEKNDLALGIEKIKHEVNLKEQQITDLNSRLNSTTNYASGMKTRMEEAEKKLSILLQEKEMLIKEKEALTTNLEQKITQLSQAEKSVSVAKENVSRQAAAIQSLEKLKQDLENKSSSYQEETSNLLKKLSTEKEHWITSEKPALLEALTVSENKCKSMADAFQRMEVACQKYETQIAETKSQIEHYQGIVVDLKQISSQVPLLTEQCKNYAKRLEELEHELEVTKAKAAQQQQLLEQESQPDAVMHEELPEKESKLSKKEDDGVFLRPSLQPNKKYQDMTVNQLKQEINRRGLKMPTPKKAEKGDKKRKSLALTKADYIAYLEKHDRRSLAPPDVVDSPSETEESEEDDE